MPLKGISQGAESAEELWEEVWEVYGSGKKGLAWYDVVSYPTVVLVFVTLLYYFVVIAHHPHPTHYSQIDLTPHLLSIDIHRILAYRRPRLDDVSIAEREAKGVTEESWWAAVTDDGNHDADANDGKLNPGPSPYLSPQPSP